MGTNPSFGERKYTSPKARFWNTSMLFGNSLQARLHQETLSDTTSAFCQNMQRQAAIGTILIVTLDKAT